MLQIGLDPGALVILLVLTHLSLAFFCVGLILMMAHDSLSGARAFFFFSLRGIISPIRSKGKPSNHQNSKNRRHPSASMRSIAGKMPRDLAKVVSIPADRRMDELL